MSKTISPSYTDTPISGVTSLEFPRGLLNFGKDFRVKSNTGKEAILVNITSPRDKQETIRLAYSEVTNVYNGTGIEPSVASPTKKGVRVLARVDDIYSVADSADASFRIDLPLSAHLVVQAPMSEFITAAQVQTIIGRLLSSVFDTGVVTTTRLEAILRGSLIPSDL